MPYHSLHYHLIWATYERHPWLVDPVERQVYGTILEKAKELGCVIHAIGGIEDHLHLAVSIPPKLAVAEAIRQFKGASAYYVNHRPHTVDEFRWQRGYGALTFGDRSMERVVAYVRNQKDHHQRNDVVALFERWDADD